MMCCQCSRLEVSIRCSQNHNITAVFSYLQEQGGIRASRQIQVKEVRKGKEEAVKTLLHTHIAGGDTQIVHDQRVLNSHSDCDGSRKRPDFQILHEHQEHLDIWVEVDEFQHLKNGAYVCELGRINEMVFWARTVQRPCVVIRVNLDSFTAPLKSSQQPLAKKERYPLILHVLQEQIAEAKRGMPAFALKLIHLFFDCPPTCNGVCGFVHQKVYASALEVARDVASAK